MAMTVIVGQSKASSIVNLCVGDCPPHSFESLSLHEEASSSLKDQSHHPILKKSLTVSPEWWPSSNPGVYVGAAVCKCAFDAFCA